MSRNAFVFVSPCLNESIDCDALHVGHTMQPRGRIHESEVFRSAPKSIAKALFCVPDWFVVLGYGFPPREEC